MKKTSKKITKKTKAVSTKEKVVMTVVLLLTLVLVTVGVTYAFFTYVGTGTTENTITTGTLTFVYDEKNASGNGIRLTNLLPQSDTVGASLVGNNQVFDFQVVGTTQGAPIAYEVIAEKGVSSTLNENVAKIYLTTVSGVAETPASTTNKNNKVTTYNQLATTKVVGQTGKTIYQETISKNQTNYTKVFRLRMWVSEDAIGGTNGEWEYNNKTFSVKVNVIANGNAMIFTPPYTDSTGANIPEPLEGMIPVTYNGTDWVKADTTNKWYDYETQMWANAVTVTETNRSTLMKAKPGTVIPMADINTMWVWIPKYEYKVEAPFGKGGISKVLPGEIEVNFKSKTDITSTTGYTLHPAFNFGGENLSGIWVGKFEVTGTVNSPTIKPNETALRDVTVSSFFNASRAMQNVGNPYGFNSEVGNIHMAKGTEWGAVAYLSQSKYGKYGNPSYTGANKEIYQNKSGKYITGYSNGTPSTNEVNTQEHYNVESAGTGASTTGTIYGIYDMSGGSNEYVMDVYNKTISNSGFSVLPDEKYYNNYTGTTGIKGDATNADGTNGWYSDYEDFITTSIPWGLHGYYQGEGSTSGIFSFFGTDGYYRVNYSTRFIAL